LVLRAPTIPSCRFKSKRTPDRDTKGTKQCEDTKPASGRKRKKTNRKKSKRRRNEQKTQDMKQQQDKMMRGGEKSCHIGRTRRR